MKCPCSENCSCKVCFYKIKQKWRPEWTPVLVAFVISGLIVIIINYLAS